MSTWINRRVIEIPSAEGKIVVLPVSWPSAKIEELGIYGTIKPRKKSR